MAQLTVAAHALKVVAMLDPAEVATLPTPEGQARSNLVIACAGKLYRADVATKALRKAKAVIANGADNVVVFVQGKLQGDEIVEAVAAQRSSSWPSM